MVSFWLDNPNVLLNKNYITELWPNNDFDLERKLNSITRLIIVLTILGYFLTKSQYIPVSAVVSIMILVIIYKTKSKSQQKEGFKAPFVKSTNVKDITKVLEKEFTLPTKKNPVMNILMNEYNDNPNRKPAAPAYNDTVIEEINDKSQNADKRLFKNLGDNLAFQHSMRNFYAMPNTQIPNSQKDFAEFCYGNMPSCKEGDSLQCSKNNALFRTT
uniref:Minor capsid protein P9 transmembrane helices domain-containing protein n=1 Tax=viral metagenome TaxID=1070528 RepID=A0A6C0JCA2_9ZZZZ